MPQLQDYPSLGYCIVVSPQDNWYKIDGNRYLMVIQALRDNQVSMNENETKLSLSYMDSHTQFSMIIPEPMSFSQLKNHTKLIYENFSYQKIGKNSIILDTNITESTPKKFFGTPGKHDEMFDSPQPDPRSIRPAIQGVSLFSSQPQFIQNNQSLHQNHFIPQSQDNVINKKILNVSIIQQIIRNAISREEFSTFIDEVDEATYPEYASVISKEVTLSSIMKKSKSLLYLNVDSFLADINQLVSNVVKYFGGSQDHEWRYIVRSAKTLRAYIISNLESHLVDHSTKDVVLSLSVQRELYRLGASYKIDSRNLDSEQNTMPDLVMTHPDQDFPLSIRIESFMKSLYHLAKSGATFSNRNYDLLRMEIVLDSSKFLSQDTYDIVPLFYSKETASLVITYQNEITSDFPVYILDLYPENTSESHQDGPFPISEFLKELVRD